MSSSKTSLLLPLQPKTMEFLKKHASLLVCSYDRPTLMKTEEFLLMLMMLMFTYEVNLLRVRGRRNITARETIGIEMTASVNDYDYVVYKTFYESQEEVR